MATGSCPAARAASPRACAALIRTSIACPVNETSSCVIERGRFAAIEARRIRKRYSIADGGGIEALAFCLSRRMYAVLNRTRFERVDERTLRFAMVDCRVQDARNRKGMVPFPCKAVGDVEFASFAKAVDERIAVSCITCPPDQHREGTWCAWEFTIPD